MRRTILGLSVLLAVTSLPSLILGQEPEALIPELALLRPFLGEWVGEFQNGDERPPVLRSWKPSHVILYRPAADRSPSPTDRGEDSEA